MQHIAFGTYIGIDGIIGSMEMTLARGTTSFTFAGLSEDEVVRTRSDVRSAITFTGLTFPDGDIK